MSLPGRGIVKRKIVVIGNLFMADLTGVQIIGRPFDHAIVGGFLVLRRFVSLVTKTTTLREMRIGVDDHAIYPKPLVHFFRLHGRRRACSPPCFAAGNMRRDKEGFQQGFVRVALDATAVFFGNGRSRAEGENENKDKRE